MENTIKEVTLLKQQIDDLSYDIYVDSYPMSVGELISTYESGDIDLKAEYQRVYKWSDNQKTKFIESLLLGLPVPPIFLYQDGDALWEVVDGIQRLSTIFEFVGVLKDDNGNYKDELVLTDAPKLTYLESLKFSNFTRDLQRVFRKSKLDLIIISKKSKKEIKLEVFRRLNGFGTTLNRQELRNALSLLINPDMFKFIENNSNASYFLECFNFCDNKTKNFEDNEEIKNKKHYEYFIRFMTLYEKDTLEKFKIKQHSKIDDLFDDVVEECAKKYNACFMDMQLTFTKVFKLLSKSLGDKSFTKYNWKKDRFENKKLESAFEMIVSGLCDYYEYYENHPDELLNKIKLLHSEGSLYKKALKTNPKAIDRMRRMRNAGSLYFNPNEQN